MLSPHIIDGLNFKKNGLGKSDKSLVIISQYSERQKPETRAMKIEMGEVNSVKNEKERRVKREGDTKL